MELKTISRTYDNNSYRIKVVKLKSPLRQFYRRHNDLGWLTVVNICVTNDHGYVSFVVIIILSFIHDFHRVCTTRVPRWVPLVEQELLTLKKHMSSPLVFGRVMLLNLLSCVAFCGSLFVLFHLVCIWSVCRLTASD